VGQVTIVAPLNVPSMLGEHASELYARNLLNLVELLIHEQVLSPTGRRSGRENRTGARRKPGGPAPAAAVAAA